MSHREIETFYTPEGESAPRRADWTNHGRRMMQRWVLAEPVLCDSCGGRLVAVYDGGDDRLACQACAVARMRAVGAAAFDLRPVPLPPDTLCPPATPLPGPGRLVGR